MSASKSKARSRFGCTNCRLRHLKCDNSHPCARCQKQGLSCDRDYDSRFRHKANPSVRTATGKSSFDFTESQTWVRTSSSLVFLDRTENLKSAYEPHRSKSQTNTNQRSSDNLDLPSPDGRIPTTDHGRHGAFAVLPQSGHLETESTLHPARSTFDQRPKKRRLTEASQALTPTTALGTVSWSPSSLPEYSSNTNWKDSSIEVLIDRTSGSPLATRTLHDSLRPPVSRLEELEDTTSALVDEAEDLDAHATPGLYTGESAFPLSDREEARLLRYFVDVLARSFDMSDPYRHFRNVVPQRASSCPILLNAIYALSARHLSRVGDYDPLISNKYHQECLNRVIPALSDPNAVLDENLLASTIILRHLEEIEVPLSTSSPSDEQSHLLGSHAFLKAQQHVVQDMTLGQAAFWTGLRQEVYIAFIHQRPIAISLDNTKIDRSCTPAADHVWSCRIVVLCADVMRHCFGDDGVSVSAHNKLCDSLKDWHDHKNSSFEPIYSHEPDEDNIFPEIWFLSDEVIVGWQHYYIAKLLLAAHNPKIPRLGPGRAAALRDIDEEIKSYVMILCGIAISHRGLAPCFTYSSMAIVAAGEKFTEPQEQDALLHVLEIGDSQYAFPSGHARDSLRAAWGWTQSTG